MTEASITIENLEDEKSNSLTKIIHISGQLDESNIDEKIQPIYKLLEENQKGLNIIFNLENLEYMNSKSIGYLTDIYGKITENKGQTIICNAKPNITDILQVVGLTQLIKTVNSLEEAKKKLNPTNKPTEPTTQEKEPQEEPTEPPQQAQEAPTEAPQQAQEPQEEPTEPPQQAQEAPTPEQPEQKQEQKNPEVKKETPQEIQDPQPQQAQQPPKEPKTQQEPKQNPEQPTQENSNETYKL